MIVELGAKGPYVRAVQRIVGVPASKVDGVCGPFTVAIIEAWQTKHGVEPDGVFGPLSRAATDPNAFVQAYEGLVLQAYDDARGPLAPRLLTWEHGVWRRADGALCIGNPTIGCGTRIWPGQEESRQRCTKQQADQWLQEFITNQLGDKLAKYLPADADNAKRAAIIALGYNGGPGAIVDAANAGFDPTWWTQHYTTAYHHVVDAGLVMRRLEEAALWCAGDV